MVATTKTIFYVTPRCPAIMHEFQIMPADIVVTIVDKQMREEYQQHPYTF